MLLLKRKVGEFIVINGNIRITVCGFKGSRVILGVTAPSDIPIVREQPPSRASISLVQQKAG